MNKYQTFYDLHHTAQPFILANAWNVKSAQLIEEHGFTAIGTSSGAIADSLGYPDGEQIPFEEMLAMVKRMTASVNIPVSVDFERGYTNDLNRLIEHVQQLLDIGVAGINIEDSQGEELYLKKLYQIRNYLEKTGQKLFINARTDGFLQKLVSPLHLTIKRASLYQQAGADGLFVTALPDAAAIEAISSSTTLPVNIAGNPSLFSFDELAKVGVKRISMAVFLYKATYNYLDDLLNNIKLQQSLQPLF